MTKFGLNDAFSNSRLGNQYPLGLEMIRVEPNVSDLAASLAAMLTMYPLRAVEGQWSSPYCSALMIQRWQLIIVRHPHRALTHLP